MTQEDKKRALRLLHNRFCELHEQVEEIEPRLADLAVEAWQAGYDYAMANNNYD